MSHCSPSEKRLVFHLSLRCQQVYRPSWPFGVQKARCERSHRGEWGYASELANCAAGCCPNGSAAIGQIMDLRSGLISVVEADFLEFNAGMTATISLAERYGQLVN